MPSRRSERVSGLLHELVADILLREVKDPRLDAVTITGARLSPDLRLARIFVRTLPKETDVTDAARGEALAGLHSATGYIRRQVAARLRLRHTPTLEFVYDDTLDKVHHLEDLFHKLRQEER